MEVVDPDHADGAAEAVAVEAFPEAPAGVGAGWGAFDGAAAVTACGRSMSEYFFFFHDEGWVWGKGLLVQHAATSSLAAVLHFRDEGQ